jgi:hypothetical protein
LFFDVLQHHGGFSHTPRTNKPGHTAIPREFAEHVPLERQVCPGKQQLLFLK